MREITITHTDRDWHQAFIEFVPRVFPGISFRRWAACDGWDNRYRAFALADSDRIVANASLMRMDLVLHGERVRGWQLGAVGTDPAYRGRGLQRRILERLLAQCPAEDLVFLFANDTVLDFYSRFGFQRRRAEHDSIIVSTQVGATLHVHDVVTRAAFDLAAQLPHLIEAPIERLELAFTPGRDWPSAEPTREYTESPLFTRGPHQLPETPFKYPTLAQT